MFENNPDPPSRTGYEILSPPSTLPADQTQPLRIAHCQFCGKKFLMQIKGRNRLWCSDAHKSSAWRYRQHHWLYPTQLNGSILFKELTP